MFGSRILRLRSSALLRAGGGHGHGAANKFHGFDQPSVDLRYKRVATVIGATMWFWLFYRFREDGGVLFGLHKPWDHHAHGGHEEGEHH